MVTPQAGGTLPFDGDSCEYLMIHKMVRETDEQGGYEAAEHAQAKNPGKTACGTCQSQQICTQVTGMNGPISKATPS